jgi:gluconate kinase
MYRAIDKGFFIKKYYFELNTDKANMASGINLNDHHPIEPWHKNIKQTDSKIYKDKRQIVYGCVSYSTAASAY